MVRDEKILALNSEMNKRDELISEPSLHVYTDASKSIDGVGAAVVCEGAVLRAALPDESSIVTAEAYAITMALNLIANYPPNSSVIFTDSLVDIKKLENSITNDCWVTKIHKQKIWLQKIHFCYKKTKFYTNQFTRSRCYGWRVVCVACSVKCVLYGVNASYVCTRSAYT